MTSTSDEFVFAARNALSFLEDDHGFTVSETILPCEVHSNYSFYKITYRKKLTRLDELFVCLATAPMRLERDLECGRGWPPEYHDTINVFELLTIESPDSQVSFTSGIYDSFGNVQKMSDQYTAPQGQRSLTRFSDEHLGQVLVVPAAAAAFHDEAVSAWMLFQ
jgi:hypothetical protein